jgi:hypothetical protein
MYRKNQYSPKHLLACALSMTVFASASLAQITLNGMVAEESFAGYADGVLDGQDTNSTIGFGGTETWGGTASVTARGYNAAATGGLTYQQLINSGGKAEAYRTTTFNDASTSLNWTITPTSPINNITNTELYYSFLINADDYTLRSGDTASHGVTVSFRHGDSSNNIGVFFGGTSGELGINYRVTGGNSIQMTGLSLQPGTNLVVLGVNAHSANPNATYSLWLNPDLSTNISDTAAIGAGDYDLSTDFGVVTGNSSFGFHGWSLHQRLNGVQSVEIDELRLGTSFADVAPVPEPSTYAAIFGAVFLALVIVRRRIRKA